MANVVGGKFKSAGGKAQPNQGISKGKAGQTKRTAKTLPGVHPAGKAETIVTSAEEKPAISTAVSKVMPPCEDSVEVVVEEPEPPGVGSAEIAEDFTDLEKIVIQYTDMPGEMQQIAVECAKEALEKYHIDNQVACHIKREFDKKYKPTWHCIVGTHFGSFLSHDQKTCIHMTFDESDHPQRFLVLFKHGGRK